MTAPTEYKVYKTRWLFLATLVSLNTISYLIGVSFSPVATLVTQYYNIDGDQIDLLVLTGWSIHVIGMLVSIYLIGKYHLLKSIRYAATMTFLGGFIRAFSTSFNVVSPKVTRKLKKKFCWLIYKTNFCHYSYAHFFFQISNLLFQFLCYKRQSNN